MITHNALCLLPHVKFHILSALADILFNPIWRINECFFPTEHVDIFLETEGMICLSTKLRFRVKNIWIDNYMTLFSVSMLLTNIFFIISRGTETPLRSWWGTRMAKFLLVSNRFQLFIIKALTIFLLIGYKRNLVYVNVCDFYLTPYSLTTGLE